MDALTAIFTLFVLGGIGLTVYALIDGDRRGYVVGLGLTLFPVLYSIFAGP